VISLHKNYGTLIKRARRGQRKAQHQLFELFAPKMKSVCRQYITCESIAEEVMLEGFFKVFSNLDAYKGEGSFEGWIRRIMINTSLSHLRKQKKLQFTSDSVLENSIDHVAMIECDFEVEEIQRCIDSLSEGYKTVFILYAVEGYKHSEIAEMLQISESTSKSQLHKARKALQQQVNQENKTHYGSQ
jgi:RNA polymerase sigma factor (sigma-70 family)